MRPHRQEPPRKSAQSFTLETYSLKSPRSGEIRPAWSAGDAGPCREVTPYSMDDQLLFDDLVRAAKKLGVAIRVEPFETPAAAGGGSCVLRGESLILLDAGAPLLQRIGALIRALSEFDSEALFMTPAAREAVEAMRDPARRMSA